MLTGVWKSRPPPHGRWFKWRRPTTIALCDLTTLEELRDYFWVPLGIIISVSRSKDRPYHRFHVRFCLSIDAMEAGLRLPFPPVVASCLEYWQISTSQMAPNSWHFPRVFLMACDSGSSRSPYVGAYRGTSLLEGDLEPLTRVLPSSGSFGDEASLHPCKRHQSGLIEPSEPLVVGGSPPMAIEPALTRAPKSPMGAEVPTPLWLGVMALHMELSVEEGYNLPLSSAGQGPYVDSSDPSLVPSVTTPSREEAVKEPSTPLGEGVLESLLVVPPPSDNGSTQWALTSHSSVVVASGHLAPSPGSLLLGSIGTKRGGGGISANDGPRYSLGIGPSSDDAVGSRRKFARRFVEGIRKLTGNAKGDRREEDWRTCHKITRGCRSVQELGLN
ncbi:hypothetical protein BHM03_00025863 [Ensete ventricosum]|nr:hypothetical protein BHM03_00025863 [Ensete ventricosum]